MRLIALCIGYFAATIGCANNAGPSPLESITACDSALLLQDAKQRLSGPHPSDEVSYELVVHENRETLEISYTSKPLSNDTDKLIVTAGGEAAVYDKKSCAFQRMKNWR